MKSKILVLGAGGQLGKTLLEVGSDRSIGLTRAELDICSEQAVGDVLSRVKPKVVINAAAYTAVDEAEKEPERAFLVNRDGARIVAQAAAAADIPFIHLSTDYVFDGNSRIPYAETDPVNPLSVYGRSKQEGEGVIRQACSKHVILRSSWIYSPLGTNFVRTMLRLGSERRELRVVDDQIGCPTAADDIARAIYAVVA